MPRVVSCCDRTPLVALELFLRGSVDSLASFFACIHQRPERETLIHENAHFLFHSNHGGPECARARSPALAVAGRTAQDRAAAARRPCQRQWADRHPPAPLRGAGGLSRQTAGRKRVLTWYRAGTLIDGHYRYDVYATPNIQRDDLTKAKLEAIPTTRQSGRFRLEQGRLLVEPDPAAQRSKLSNISTLMAALWDQLIPAAAQNLTASGAEAHVI